MKVEQRHWTAKHHWLPSHSELDDADLVFVFGDSTLFKSGVLIGDIRKSYPQAHLFGCSTAGEICGVEVHEDSLTTTALRFNSTTMKYARLHLSEIPHGREAGRKLALSLDRRDLIHVFVLCTGLNVNGGDLIQGLVQNLPSGVTVSGGLAGDLGRFQETYVISGDALAKDLVAVVGLYGHQLEVHFSSYSGWTPFGPERRITRSHGATLYELDGKSALDLYRKYLGEEAQELPGNGLTIPFSLCSPGREDGVIRSVLAIDEKSKGLVFAGDMPEGMSCRFMKVSPEKLIEGAQKAAHQCFPNPPRSLPELAILVSCGGRKQMLHERVEEEIESVHHVLGPETALTGFYAYGEFSASSSQAQCDLQNQSITITTLHEVEEDDEDAA